MNLFKLFFVIFLIPSLCLAADVGPFINAAQHGIWSLRLQDGSGNLITSTAGALNVNISSGSITVTGPIAVTQSGTWTTGRTWSLLNTTDSVNVGNFPATQAVTQSTSPWVISGSVGLNTGSNTIGKVDQGVGGASAWKVDGSAVTQPISAVSLPLPAGAATSALQTSGNTSLSSIDGKLTTTVNGLKVDGSAVTQPISGTVTANAGTGNFTVVQSSGANLHVNVDNTIPISGTITANQGTSPWVVSGTVAATQSGSWTTGRTWTLLNTTDSVNVGNFPATQAVTQSTSPWVVSGTVTSNIGTTGGLALDTSVNGLQVSQGSTTSGQKGGITLGAVTTAAPTYTTAQTNPLSLTTAGALRTDSSATTQPVSGTITANQGTSPWVSNVTQFGSSNVVTGTGNSGAGIPRVTVSNDSSITNISGTISLPTGAATEASLAKLTITQGTALGSNTQALVGGSVTTNQPTYTTGQISPLSLNVRGALRSKTTGYDSVTLIRNAYSTTNVTTAAYVQLVASTTADINRLHIFDSSGQDFVLATGGAGSEVDQIQISPGGWDAPVDIFIASGTRISIKAVSATANSGILLITGLK